MKPSFFDFETTSMNKLFCFLLFFTTCFCVNAQNARFGLQAGLSISNYIWEDPYGVKFNRSKPGFTGGVLVDISVGNNFSIQPAFNYVQKGTRAEFEPKGAMNVNCLELAANFLYKTRGASGAFFAGVGPTFTLHVSGRSEYKNASGEWVEDIYFGNDENNDHLKSKDFGANVLGGYQFSNGFFVSAGYNHGLSNINPYNGDETIRDTYYSFRIGFMLGGKK